MSSDVVGGFQVLIGIIFTVIPLVLFVWVLLQLRIVADESRLLRRQLQEIARHMGAPIATGRGVRRPTATSDTP